MTAHVLTIVNARQVLAQCDPVALREAVGAFSAVDVRLRGFSGAGGYTNCDRLDDKLWKRWKGHLDGVWEGDDGERPTAARVIYGLARLAGAEAWGHGWLEAANDAQAYQEAGFVLPVVDEYGLARWGVNAEIGTFGRGKPLTSVPRQRIRAGQDASRAFRYAMRAAHSVALDWMGFADLTWMYGAGPEHDAEFVALWDECAQMAYQTAWEGRAGAKATCERGRALWTGPWSPLVGVGRWHDDNRNGRVDPGEVVGSVSTLRNIIAEFAPERVRHYVGNDAATQITVGRPDYPALGSLVRGL